jgi:hypothetical protein
MTFLMEYDQHLMVASLVLHELAGPLHEKGKIIVPKPVRKKMTYRDLSRCPTKLILDQRLCDLHLSIKGTVLEERIACIHDELNRRSLLIRPYFWLSDDWFTPDGTTGSAIPFYLAHPRLMRIERSQMGEVEGGTRDWCMKLLRHEVGHVVQHAFLLAKRRRWQQHFGLSSCSYPRFYRPKPSSRRYVHHLEYWYAQSHPDEDFAETFAVWLKPHSPWRKKYKGWPALKKLEYVDGLMAEIAGRKPPVRTRSYVDSLSTLNKTLHEHYTHKKEIYGSEYPDIYDPDLLELFSSARGKGKREKASAFIRRVRSELVRTITPWTRDYRYHFEHVLKEIVGRCRELKLYVQCSDRRTKTGLAVILTKHTMNCLYRNRRWVEM